MELLEDLKKLTQWSQKFQLALCVAYLLLVVSCATMLFGIAFFFFRFAFWLL